MPDEGPQSTGDEFMDRLLTQANSLGAHLREATRPPVFEYISAEWDQVNRLASKGWALMSVPAVPGYVFGAGLDKYRFIMQRQLPLAAALLAELEGGPE